MEEVRLVMGGQDEEEGMSVIRTVGIDSLEREREREFRDGEKIKKVRG